MSLGVRIIFRPSLGASCAHMLESLTAALPSEASRPLQAFSSLWTTRQGPARWNRLPGQGRETRGRRLSAARAKCSKKRAAGLFLQHEDRPDADLVASRSAAGGGRADHAPAIGQIERQQLLG